MSEIDKYLKEILTQMQEEQTKFHKLQQQRLDSKLLEIEKIFLSNAKELAQALELALANLAKEQKAWEESLTSLENSYTQLLESFNILYNNLKK